MTMFTSLFINKSDYLMPVKIMMFMMPDLKVWTDEETN